MLAFISPDTVMPALSPPRCVGLAQRYPPLYRRRSAALLDDEIARPDPAITYESEH